MQKRATTSPPLRLTLAIAALAHGALLLMGSFQKTYDAYVHMFFANHYAQDWFSTWDTRWYTGFTVTSYPPGSHQLMALLSRAIGLEPAFVVVQMASVLILAIGVKRFSRIWVSESAANWAALLLVLSTSIAEAVHVFGQLPTTFSLGLLLNALPFINRWLVEGHRPSLVVGLATVAATTGGHHVTVLFGSVFFLGPIVARALLDQARVPVDGEVEGHYRFVMPSHWWPLIARRLSRIVPFTIRLGIVGFAMLATLVLVVLPYWLWSASDPISQVPIPHSSRDNFLDNPNAGLVFFLVPWGPLLLLAPILVVREIRTRRWPLAASIGLLALLGTGGTTPIPKLLLGGAFDILTLDRFTLWATIAILPLAGQFAANLAGATASRKMDLVRTSVAVVLAASFLFAATLGRFRPLQPDSIDPAPITEFLERDQHDRWRYLALGFGDQMARVSAQTAATTPDGNYHSVRRLPELVSRPVERLEGAKFRGIRGIGSLQQFLTTPERYNLKFVFSNDEFYDPLLSASGWQRLGPLRNNIMVWERGDVPPLPPVLTVKEIPWWQRLMWSTLPMTGVLAAIITQTWAAVGRGRRDHRAGFAHSALPRFRRILRNAQNSLSPVSVNVPSVWSVPTLGLRARQLGYGLWAATFLYLGLGVMGELNPTPRNEPAAQVIAYYDDLDFKRYEQAWNRLDPATRPTKEQFDLDRSVTDGLVAGYAKLDSIVVTGVEMKDDNVAEVMVDLQYLTSVESYEFSTSHLVLNRSGRWFVEPEYRVDTIPSQQFIRRTTVDYLDLGRRLQTTGPTDYNDVLDRPRVEFLDAQVLRRGTRWHIVGQITNVDVDPADLTITGTLLDADDEPMASYAAGQASVLKVLPGETVPFRVDFEGVAGAIAGTDLSDPEFNPDAVTEIVLDEPVASYELSVKALVTGRNLERLAPTQLKSGSGRLSGRIQNDLTATATIPRVVVAQLIDGEVAWVDVEYLPDAIRPQRSAAFEFDLTDLSTIESVPIPGLWNDNGRTDTVDAAFSLASTASGSGTGDPDIRIIATTFTRELQP
jgi:hypothetical protein